MCLLGVCTSWQVLRWMFEGQMGWAEPQQNVREKARKTMTFLEASIPDAAHRSRQLACIGSSWVWAFSHDLTSGSYCVHAKGG